MSVNPYIQIYTEQVGSGLAAYSGVRYQRGHGFFGKLISGIGNFIKDLAPGIFKRSLPSAIGLAQDIASGQNIGQAAKNRLIEAGKNIADETLENIQMKLQKGRGIGMYRYRTNSNRFLRGIEIAKIKKKEHAKELIKGKK